MQPRRVVGLAQRREDRKASAAAWTVPARVALAAKRRQIIGATLRSSQHLSGWAARLGRVGAGNAVCSVVGAGWLVVSAGLGDGAGDEGGGGPAHDVGGLCGVEPGDVSHNDERFGSEDEGEGMAESA